MYKIKIKLICECIWTCSFWVLLPISCLSITDVGNLIPHVLVLFVCFVFFKCGDHVLLGPVKTRHNSQIQTRAEVLAKPLVQGVRNVSVLGLADSI